MKSVIARTVIGLSGLLLWSAEFSPGTPASLRLVADAQAIVGAPLTPVSYAGVARRTTRRAVAYTGAATTSAATASAASASAASASAASASAASAEAAAASASAAAAQAPPAVPVGTIVTSLPPGCQSMTMDGKDYFSCGGVFYRPAYQGNNLVYVVTQP